MARRSAGGAPSGRQHASIISLVLPTGTRAALGSTGAATTTGAATLAGLTALGAFGALAGLAGSGSTAKAGTGSSAGSASGVATALVTGDHTHDVYRALRGETPSRGSTTKSTVGMASAPRAFFAARMALYLVV